MKKSIHENKVPLDYRDRKVCVLGLGFVGLTLAISLADVGFNVTGVEIRDDLRAQLLSGNPCIFEPGLNSMLNKVLENKTLTICGSIPKNCDSTVYIITVGTPISEDKKINLASVKMISEEIASHLKDHDLIILRSTVKLGTSRSIVQPILKQTGKSFEIAFCPERTVEGQAMEELRYLPQIIGADCLSTRVRVSQLFQFLTPTVIRVSDLETAEMIKLIDNTKRDVSFGFSNEVAHLCDVAGLSANEVITAGRFSYSRTDLPLPGPVGGPCLSKDSHILIQSMMDYGIVPEIVAAARKINERQPTEVVGFLKQFLETQQGFPKNPIISLLGIAFKGRPATDDTRGTSAKSILKALEEAFPNAHFRGFDPVVSLDVIKEFGIQPQLDAKQAFAGSHLALILNNHPFFSSMPLETWALDMARPAVIYDFWNNFSRTNLCLPPEVKYIALGSHKYAEPTS
jgi:nucleotide sugar dehydrogenase